VIRRILENLEADPGREVQAGLDPAGRVAWRQRAGELLERSGRWQGRLRALGVGPGDRVALDLPRGPDLVAAHLAALAAGAALVPLNPALSAAERARVLERADVRALLGPDERPAATAALALAARDPELPALLIFTSGTTGEPKGVPLREANLEANLAALQAVWGISAADRLLHALPAHHVHGLVLALYGLLRAGAAVVMMSRFDADVCLRSAERLGITLFMGVPTMYHRMIQSPVEADLRAMRLFVSGSAPLAPRDFREFAARFGHEPLERYGLTETLIAASNPLDGERRPGAVGRALPDTELRLAPDGEIEVRGPAVMAGYWRAPEATRDAFREGFFRTGDLGRFDASGYLVIAGRKKELIIVGGSNVLPGEVERALQGEPDVEELAVAGLRDPDRGEIVAAFIVPAARADPRAIERRLRARAEAALAPYKRPHSYRFLGGLPRNPMGKIDRRALTEAG
jgi:malonyl-CoA/methylmalonyl-CoA synthetase